MGEPLKLVDDRRKKSAFTEKIFEILTFTPLFKNKIAVRTKECDRRLHLLQLKNNRVVLKLLSASGVLFTFILSEDASEVRWISSKILTTSLAAEPSSSNVNTTSINFLYPEEHVSAFTISQGTVLILQTMFFSSSTWKIKI